MSKGAPAEATNVVDLMDALKRSVDAVRSGRKKTKAAAADGDDLDELSKSELYERATELGIHGRSGMNREELRDALQKARAA